jgi:hypothetical protein
VKFGGRLVDVGYVAGAKDEDASAGVAALPRRGVCAWESTWEGACDAGELGIVFWGNKGG